jgi:hypothetical protein
MCSVFLCRHGAFVHTARVQSLLPDSSTNSIHPVSLRVTHTHTHSLTHTRARERCFIVHPLDNTELRGLQSRAAFAPVPQRGLDPGPFCGQDNLQRAMRNNERREEVRLTDKPSQIRIFYPSAGEVLHDAKP